MRYSILNREHPHHPHLPFDFDHAEPALTASVRRDEDYAFGLVFVPDSGGTAALSYSPLNAETGETIPASAYDCINLGGTDVDGKPFVKEVCAAAGEQTIFWLTLRIPEEAAEVGYTGSVTLTVGEESAVIPVIVTVSGFAVEHGWGEPEKLTRLRWLNSTLAQDGGATRPYFQPVRDRGTVKLLGRELAVQPCGLPGAVLSHFNKNIEITPETHVLSDGLSLSFTLTDGTVFSLADLTGKAFETEETSDGWRFRARSEGHGLSAEIVTDVEFDGFVGCQVSVRALREIAFEDCSLSYTMKPGFDGLTLGLGQKGGALPDSHEFRWDAEKHQNSLWIGGVNGGLRCEFKGEDFVEPLVNIYYRHRPLKMSRAYANPDENGIPQGTVLVKRDETGAHTATHSGRIVLNAGETLRFDFDLLVTPLKEFDLAARMRTRYYHSGSATVEAAVESGATHVTLHHAGEVNPYINYPFLTWDRMIPFVKKAHEAGLGAKFYYTVREQSDKTCEMDAFLTLGEEMFPSPVGGQGSILWSDESLKGFRARFGDKYIPAWSTQYDMAVITDGQSRLCNYYIEGLERLCRDVGIDGIYIDDVAYDRRTIRRARRILDANGRGDACGIGCRDRRKIDLHSWNHYCGYAGYGNSLNLYMTLLPYIDSLWIGEGFDHMGESPEFWLTEIAGLPYGMTSELLLNGEEHFDAKYRGMLFGMTSRQPWTAADPRGLWAISERFKLGESRLWGFWNEESPAASGEERVKISLYRGAEYDVLALASWDRENAVTVSPTLDGKEIPTGEIPAIPDFQEGTSFDGSVTIAPGGGCLIVIRK